MADLRGGEGVLPGIMCGRGGGQVRGKDILGGVGTGVQRCGS